MVYSLRDPNYNDMAYSFEEYLLFKTAWKEDEHDWNQVLIDNKETGKRWTRGEIRHYYENPAIRKKILDQILNKPVMVFLGINRNKHILKRNHEGKPITITNDSPEEVDAPTNYEYWIRRRLLSFHYVSLQKSNKIWVDLDPHGAVPFAKTVKYAREVAPWVAKLFNAKMSIWQSGGMGVHVEGTLDNEIDVDIARNKLKDFLNRFNLKYKDVTTGIAKEGQIRSDVTTLHKTGNLRLRYAIGEITGRIKIPLSEYLQKSYIVKSLLPVALMKLKTVTDPDIVAKKYGENNIAVQEKLDGWKLSVIKDNDKVKIYSRRGEDKTENFPDVAKALEYLPNGSYIEGEIVWYSKGKQLIGNITSIAGSSPKKAEEKIKEFSGYYRFRPYDILFYDNIPIYKKNFAERDNLLGKIIVSSDLIKKVESYPFDEHQKLFELSLHSGGEGIVLKRKDMPYIFRPLGELEPAPSDTSFKYKGSREKEWDFVVYDYMRSPESGKLILKFGQYYEGHLYGISEINNFSEVKERELLDLLKREKKFVITIKGQELVSNGVRHQRFVRIRQDKDIKDVMMEPMFTRNLVNLEKIY